jgi:hypothetical protein
MSSLETDADGFLLWFRTPDPMQIASDPPGYTIHKTVTGDSAEYELRRDWPAMGYGTLLTVRQNPETQLWIVEGSRAASCD